MTGFIKNSSFSTSVEEHEDQTTLSASNIHIEAGHGAIGHRTRGFLPPKLPTIDCSSLPRYVPPLLTNSNSDAGLTGSKPFQDKDDSPKLPPSPVLKALGAAIDLSVGHHSHSQGHLVREPSEEKKYVYRKVSNRLRDSSSSSDDEDINRLPRSFGGSSGTLLPGTTPSTYRPGTCSAQSNSNESTPSPRTPNSFKILSQAAKNEATAFTFPPSPCFSSRPSSHERQSSDDYSTPFSSLRSRSTSSEICEDVPVGLTSTVNGTQGLIPAPLPRSRRVSPLRKQQAIAEEADSCSAYHAMRQTTTSPRDLDSGLSDGHSTPPRSGSHAPCFVRETHVKRCRSSVEVECPASLRLVRSQNNSQESTGSFSESDDNGMANTQAIFRKVTIKKKAPPVPTSVNSGSSPVKVINHLDHDAEGVGQEARAHVIGKNIQRPFR